MPIIQDRVFTPTFKFLTENVEKKLKGWKVRILSQAARSLLVQSVLNSLPAYAMQTTIIPAAVIDDIERHTRKFFWDELDDTKHLYFLPWNMICQLKKSGGLGIKNLRQLNLAFLAKLGWRLLTEDEPLWIRILKTKYGSPLAKTKCQSCSLTWRGIKTCEPLLRLGLGIHGESNQNIPAEIRWQAHHQVNSQSLMHMLSRTHTFNFWRVQIGAKSGI